MDARTSSILFNENGHLSGDAEALMVEALLREEIETVPEPVRVHVEDCKDCKNGILELVTFLRNPDSGAVYKEELTKTPVQPPVPGEVRRKWRFSAGRIAAVFVVVAFMAAAYVLVFEDPSLLNRYFSGSGHESGRDRQQAVTPASGGDPGSRGAVKRDNHPGREPSGQTKNNRTGKRQITPDPAARYRVNPNLENMIGSRLRGRSFEVLEPPDNKVVTLPVRFLWKQSFTEPHTLKIVNNSSKVIYSFNVTGTVFDFDGKLGPGLYYWKLESKNELLYVGKFFIGEPPGK